jgi:hypothetical protein
MTDGTKQDGEGASCIDKSVAQNLPSLNREMVIHTEFNIGLCKFSMDRKVYNVTILTCRTSHKVRRSCEVPVQARNHLQSGSFESLGAGTGRKLMNGCM